MSSTHDAGHQVPVAVTGLGGHRCAYREYPQGIRYRQRALRRILSAIEWQGVRPPLALGIEIDPAYLIGKQIDQPSHHIGIRTEDTELLAVAGIPDMVDHFLFIRESNNRNDRPELLLMIDAHVRGYRV